MKNQKRAGQIAPGRALEVEGPNGIRWFGEIIDGDAFCFTVRPEGASGWPDIVFDEGIESITGYRITRFL